MVVDFDASNGGPRTWSFADKRHLIVVVGHHSAPSPSEQLLVDETFP